MYKRHVICSNCEKSGHEYKDCNEPITSWGIIVVNINKDVINKQKIEHSNVNIKNRLSCINPKSSDDLTKISLLMNNIRFLLIQRKHSLGYIDFMRGRYKTENVDGISFLFQYMTPTEINGLKTRPFEELWHELWNNDKKRIDYLKREFNLSKNKFLQLKSGDLLEYDLNFFIDNVKPLFNNQEWGFPKGRKDKNEHPLDCALREFEEETQIKRECIKIIKEVEPIEEYLIGTNGIKYKHIYYLAEMDNLEMVNIDNNNEIGDLGYFTYTEALDLIRDYHQEKKNILMSIYLYYLEILIQT